MCDRARRSRDASSRYSIDTLFPTLTTTKHKSLLDNSDRDSGLEHGSGSGHDGGITGAGNGTSTGKRSEPTITVTAAGGKRSRLLLEGSSSVSTSSSARVRIEGTNGNTDVSTGLMTTSNSKRKAASPLKPMIQPKQINLNSNSNFGMGIMSKKNMLLAFQPWVMQTYGDSAKTKTITQKKYHRIVKTLRGEEINNAENSKFRFWVKAKGFHIGPPPSLVSTTTNHKNQDDEQDNLSSDPEQPDLYVPTTVKDGGGEKPVYKRVAVVEHFFDIIYTVHVETEAKNGKHAGQKRTYRAITEKYAFLPREAVTKFLLQCMECQKRGNGGTGGAESPPINLNINGNGNGKGGRTSTQTHLQLQVETSPPEKESPVRLLSNATTSTAVSDKGTGISSGDLKVGKSKRKHGNGTTMDINFSLPFTTTYTLRQHQQQQAKIQVERKQMRERERVREREREQELKMKREREREREDEDRDEDDDEDEHEDEDTHVHNDPSPMEEDHVGPIVGRSNGKGGDGQVTEIPAPVEWLGYHPISFKKEASSTNNNSIYSNGKHDLREQSSPLPLSERSVVNHEAGQDETSSNGNKDDEDDDDDESEDKEISQQHDPERLKAFNMFVRLFVDENLDRMVPISKQPKEKIQAIIDSCTRQFPEFAERARKRIRTYLKSCRRNKRSRDGTNGWESSRPTPAHLTSVQAEQILAQACENESQNAKRMRMGLEPVGQPLPLPANDSRSSDVVENGHRSTTTSSRDRERERERERNSRSTISEEVERSTKSPEKEKSSSKSASSSLIAASSNLTSSSSTSLSSSAMVTAAAVAAAAAAAAAASSSLSVASPTVAEMLAPNHNHQHSPLTNPTTTTSSHGGRSPSCENQHPSGVVSAPKAHDRSPLVDYSRALNGNGVSNMYRPNFGQAFQRPTPAFPTLFPSTGSVGSFPNHNASPLAIPNDAGPTDLSMKSKPLLTHKLNATEIATVRQLITGYRESAAFLLRSADELEQLLIQQQ